MSGQYYKRGGLTSYLHIYSTNATHVASVSVRRNMTPRCFKRKDKYSLCAVLKVSTCSGLSVEPFHTHKSGK